MFRWARGTRTTRLACGMCCALGGLLGWIPALSLATEPWWTPALLIDDSATFRLVSFQEPGVGSDSPVPGSGGEGLGVDPESLLSGFNAVATTPSQETLPGPTFDSPVTTLTLAPSTIAKTPAAIFVIDQEMIRRSGAQTIPDILRMVPGVHVGIGSGTSPNVSIRGFGAEGAAPLSSRILVLIDGRSLYDPLLGGLLWRNNDLVLQDIERIEVIRGPGATIWGANAVNGVVNIITKSATQTEGLLLSSLGGNEYHNITVARYGAKVGDDAYLRVYGKFRDFDDQYRDPADAAGSIPFQDRPANDGYHEFQAGFRYDKAFESSDRLSVQGRIAAAPPSTAETFPFTNIYNGPAPSGHFTGSVQSEFVHLFDNDSSLTFLAIYDRSDIEGANGRYHRDSYVLDAAYRWSWTDRHRLVAGAQFRVDRDTYLELQYPDVDFLFDPASQTRNIPNWLLQDEIILVPDELTALVGTKMEVNPYTGFEIQPSARLLRTIDEHRVAWVAVSRAIRRPARIEEHAALRGPLLPGTGLTPFVVNSTPTLQSSSLIAFEAGYRSEAIDNVSWDIATFYNLYDNLVRYVADTSNPLLVTISPDNGIVAQSYGAELSGTVKLTENWSVIGCYSTFASFAASAPLTAGQIPRGDEVSYEGSTPRNIVYLRNSWSPADKVDTDVIMRYCDTVDLGRIPAYVEMDCRLAWRPRERLELALVGQNLLDSAHVEYGVPEQTSLDRVRTQVQRSVYGSITYEY